MKYIETTIYTSPEGMELVCQMLSEMGIESLVVENPDDLTDFMNKKNSYDWDYLDEKVMALAEVEANVKFYLEISHEGEKMLDEVRIKAMMLKSKEYEGTFGLGISLGRLYVESKIVDDEDWKDNWKEYFKTVRVTDRLVIKPSWEEYSKEKVKKNEIKKK